MKKQTNYSEEKITIEMTFEEEAAILVAIIGEILSLRKMVNDLKEEGRFSDTIEAAKKRIETLETIKREL